MVGSVENNVNPAISELQCFFSEDIDLWCTERVLSIHLHPTLFRALVLMLDLDD